MIFSPQIEASKLSLKNAWLPLIYFKFQQPLRRSAFPAVAGTAVKKPDFFGPPRDEQNVSTVAKVGTRAHTTRPKGSMGWWLLVGFDLLPENQSIFSFDVALVRASTQISLRMLLLLRIRSVHLEILGFHMGGAY